MVFIFDSDTSALLRKESLIMAGEINGRNLPSSPCWRPAQRTQFVRYRASRCSDDSGCCRKAQWMYKHRYRPVHEDRCLNVTMICAEYGYTCACTHVRKCHLYDCEVSIILALQHWCSTKVTCHTVDGCDSTCVDRHRTWIGKKREKDREWHISFKCTLYFVWDTADEI